jgi:hypothetical protein
MCTPHECIVRLPQQRTSVHGGKAAAAQWPVDEQVLVLDLPAAIDESTNISTNASHTDGCEKSLKDAGLQCCCEHRSGRHW